MARVRIEGFRELERSLLALSQREAKKIARAAVRKAARPVLVAARANVHVKSGKLKRALTLRVDSPRGEPSVMSALVYVRFTGDYRPRLTDRWSTVKGKFGPPKYDYQIGSTPNVYGMFEEFGAPGHGVAAHPFLRPAWDSHGGLTAARQMGDDLAEGVIKALAGR